jgi:hypothetical protein
MPKRRRETRTTVERKIYFYRINAGCDDSGRPLPFDPAPVVQCINALPFTIDGRYWDSGEGNVTCCWVDREMPMLRLRLGNIRRSGLPQLEQNGTISPL